MERVSRGEGMLASHPITQAVRAEGRPLWVLECSHVAGWEPGRAWFPVDRRECVRGSAFACSIPVILAKVHLEPLAVPADPLFSMPEIMKWQEFQRFLLRSHPWLIFSLCLVYLVAKLLNILVLRLHSLKIRVILKNRSHFSSIVYVKLLVCVK